MTARQTLLITVTGPDRPGVTAALFEVLAMHPADVLDVEQVVIRGHLILGALLAVDGAGEIALAVHEVADRLGMTVSLVPGVQVEDPRRRGRLLVTVLGSPLTPAAFGAVAACIAAQDGNIDRIGRVASYPLTAIELEVSGTALDELRAALSITAATEHVDVAVQRAGLGRRGQWLVVMDVDSTFIQEEVIDLLAERAGRLDEVRSLTTAAMVGEIDFAASLRSRVALLQGQPEAVLAEVRDQVRLTPGAATLVRTLHELGYHIALVSGGFEEVVAPIAAALGITRYRANRLGIESGHLTGEVVGPIIDRAGKAQALREFAAELGVPMSRTIAVGDGANDLDMLAAAGLGVAFNAKPLVREAADASVNQPYLDSILFLLGITREEVEEASGQRG